MELAAINRHFFQRVPFEYPADNPINPGFHFSFSP
jgi:hypothetical protein